MIVYIIAIGVLFLAGLKVRKNDADILSRSDTTIINGVFTLVILISHSTQYCTLQNDLTGELYIHFRNFHNQWVVATFLAFSGYGVMSRMQSGGVEYLKKYPRYRILKTLIHFDIAVLLYLLVNTVLGNDYPLSDILLSFVGIKGIGNSNWYIFDILIMYVISYLAAKMASGDYKKQSAIISAATVLFIAIMQITGMPSRFVSTISCYALGVWICVDKDKIVSAFKGKKVLSLFVLCIILLITYKLRYNDYVMNVSSMAFVMAFVWLDIFFEIKSNILHFIGDHAFSIFILQRLPMMVLGHFEILTEKPYLFVAVCLMVTLVLSVAFEFLVRKLVVF